MQNSDLIKQLIAYLASYGELPTNVTSVDCDGVKITINSVPIKRDTPLLEKHMDWAIEHLGIDGGATRREKCAALADCFKTYFLMMYDEATDMDIDADSVDTYPEKEFFALVERIIKIRI